jgi:hypothetical protein
VGYGFDEDLFGFSPGGATIIRYTSNLTITVTLSQHSRE